MVEGQHAKYGKKYTFYRNVSNNLAKRIAKETDCPLISREDSKNSKWWPILFIGKYASKDRMGRYIWRLRSELNSALDKVDLEHIQLYARELDKE